MSIKKHMHGGNVYQYQNCLDFSANCNPLGTPERVKRAIIQSVEGIGAYPQVGCGELKRAIANYESRFPEAARGEEQGEKLLITEDQVICGNGAAELIFSLCRAVRPKKALLLAPTFAEYEQALRSVGCEIEYFYLSEEEGFSVSEVFLQKLHQELDLIFFCNPNNPTGILTEKEFLLKVLKRCRALNILLAVDECFLDFVKDTEKYTLKDQLNGNSNLFLLKAFTKRYAMAGVRLGYGLCSNSALLEQMELVTQPWNVSSMAQAAGIAALQENQYVEQGRQLIFREQEYLREELQRLGLKVFASQANYVFFAGPKGLFEACVKLGILIRDCSNYVGLEPGYYRIAVKKQEENEKLIQTLRVVLKSV